MMHRAITVPARFRPFAEATLATALERIRKEIATSGVPDFMLDNASGAVTVAVSVTPMEYVRPQGTAAAA